MSRLALLGFEIQRASRSRWTVALRLLCGLALLVGFAAAYRGLRPLPGVGRELLFALGWLLLTGVYLIQPPLMIRAFHAARRRGTLDLMRVCGVSRGGFLMQTFVARLALVLTVQLLALPLAAVAYALGGVGRDELLGLVALLAVATVHAGAIGLLGAVLKPRMGPALLTGWMWAVVLWILVHVAGFCLWLLPWGGWVERLTSGTGQPVLTTVILEREAGLDTLAAELVVPLLVTWIALRMARIIWIDRGAELPPPVPRTVTDPLHSWARLPDDEPVAWRTTYRSAFGGRAQFKLKGALTLGAFFAGWGAAQPLVGPLLVLLLLLLVTVAVVAATAIPAERACGALDGLLMTPMAGREIVTQSLGSGERVAGTIWPPVLVLAAWDLWGVGLSGDLARTLLGSALALTAVYMLIQLALWLGMSAGLLLRRSELSTPIAVALCLGLAIGPVALDQALDGEPGWLERLSPAWSLVRLWRDDVPPLDLNDYPSRIPLRFRYPLWHHAALHLLGVGLATAALRALVQRHADRLLGRPGYL